MPNEDNPAQSKIWNQEFDDKLTYVPFSHVIFNHETRKVEQFIGTDAEAIKYAYGKGTAYTVFTLVET